jgi:hypothetical protein
LQQQRAGFSSSEPFLFVGARTFFDLDAFPPLGGAGLLKRLAVGYLRGRGT